MGLSRNVAFALLGAVAYFTLAILAVERARGASVPLSSLPARGAIAATDQLPNLPSGSANLQASTAQDVQNFVLTSVKSYGAVGDGLTDDTVALQNAINSGLSLYCPAGTYKTTATLNFITTTNHGQTLRGGGSTSQAGGGGSACTIKPSAAVAVAIKIDGTAFSGYVQSLGIENLAVDMTNMSDLATSIAFYQGQAFDIRYNNVRVVNYGLNKLSWYFYAGAYTTQLNNCQGGQIYFDGISFSNATTTISLNNCDLLSIYHDHFVNVTINGGAVQQPYTASVPIIYLAPGTTPYGYVPNTAGLYAAVMSNIQFSNNFTSVGTDWEQGGGYPGTYNDGTHGVLTLIRVVEVSANSTNTTFINSNFAGMYLLDYGVNTRVIGQPYGGCCGVDIHNGLNIEMGDAGNVGTLFGLTSLADYLSTVTTKTWSITGSTGAASFFKESIKPTADADLIWQLKNAAGTVLLDYASNTPALNLYNGISLKAYSDTGTTQYFQLDSATGLTTWKNAGTTTITVTPSNGHIAATALNGVLGDVTPALATVTTLNATTGINLGAGSGHLLCAAAAPTISSGFGTGATIVSNNGSCSFQINVGTGGTANSGVIGLATATTGWDCMANDITTTSATVFLTKQTASTTASATIGNFNTSAAAAAWVASDKINVQCQAN